MEDTARKSIIKKFLEWSGIHLHFRPKFYKVLAVVAGGFLAFFIYMLYYTTSPSFCNSCHIMKPYYDAWSTSKHNKVTCVACHYPPRTREALWVKFQAVNSVVQFFTKKYSSKPYAQIEDASCLRSNCHSTTFLAKKLTFKKGIIFDHKFHLGDLRRGKQLRCTSCHSQIVVGTHVEVTESTCFLCHFKHAEGQKGVLPLGNCITCHEYPKRDIQFQGFTFNHRDFVGARHVSCEKCHRDIIKGEGHAPKERCYDCHNQPAILAKYEDITFIHENHVAKRKVDCTRCHDEIKHGFQASKVRFMEYNCEVCHSAVHSGPKEMFMGEGGRGAPQTPSHMLVARLDCQACHIQPKGAELKSGGNGRTFVASEKACMNCHGDQYQGMLKDWQGTFEVMIRDIAPKINSARQAIEKAGTTKGKWGQAQKLYEDAKYNVDFVRIGRGVHNPFYAAELIQVADRNIDRLFRLVGQSAPGLPAQSPIKGGYCAQLCHTKAGVKLPREASLDGAKLPHTRHAFDFGLGCTSCHSAERHKEVAIKKDGCMACHHSPDNTNCTRCHQSQTALYGAQNLPLKVAEAKASVKAGKVECVGCHDFSKKQTLENISSACTQCHDKAYVDLLKGWKEETLDAQKKIKALLEKNSKKLMDALRAKRSVGQAANLLEQGKTAYEFVAKAKGVHNAELAGMILEQAQKDVQKAGEILGSPGVKGGK